MSLTLAELEENARALPPHERALLAHRLIDSLDEISPDAEKAKLWSEENGEIEEAWLEESEKRLRDHEEGNTKTYDHGEFIEKLESLLNEKS